MASVERRLTREDKPELVACHEHPVTLGQATALYVLATLVLTWPTITGLTSDIPWDLGDSLLNCWILGWDSDHLLRFFGGDFSALRGFWNGNIFGRDPLALAYSEHLLALAVPVLPVYAATKNLILCYNLLFLSTFVLSGLGTYLLVRDLTASRSAAFVAGLIYAFAPYRLQQFSHLQVMSSQWMPFALFGFRRFFERRAKSLLSGWGPLLGASAAIVAQNLSCGYYLFFFFPFAIAYVLFEIGSRHLWRDRAMWTGLAIAAVGVAAATAPFLMPYLDLRRRGMPPRAIEEVVGYSADVYSYLTAHGAHRLYAERLRAFPKPEGDLFMGFVPLFLGGFALLVHVKSLWTRAPRAPVSVRPWVVRTAAIVAAAAVLLLISIPLTGGLQVSLAGISFRARSGFRPLVLLLVALAVLTRHSARLRGVLRGTPGSVLGFYAAALAACVWLSLGPAPQTMGTPMHDPGLYRFFYRFVPGFDGLRVPARFGMLSMLFLAVLAGFGAQHLGRRIRYGPALILLLGLVFLCEVNAAPISLNGTWDAAGLARPDAYVLPGPATFEVYRAARSLPPDTVIAELPFGDNEYDLRYMYYSTTHWRRLLNGYSGAFPPWYSGAQKILGSVPNSHLDEARQFLVMSGVTHVIVHERSFLADNGSRTSAWLHAIGGREIANFDGDRLFELEKR